MNAGALVFCLLDADAAYTPQGYSLLSSTTAGDYELKLWKGRGHVGGRSVTFAEMSLNRAGLSFDPESQRQKFTGSIHALGQRHDLLHTVAKWLQEYGPIYVGSHNAQKLGFYHRILRRYLPRLKISEPFPAFDESEGVPDYFCIEPGQETLESLLESLDDVNPERELKRLPSLLNQAKAHGIRLLDNWREDHTLVPDTRYNCAGWATHTVMRQVYKEHDFTGHSEEFDREPAKSLYAFFVAYAGRLLGIEENADDPLDGVDPSSYIDALPAVLDRMKAECRSEFDKKQAGGDINSENKHEWAESIVISVVNKFFHPPQSQVVEWGDVESRVFPELMTFLVLYADEKL